MEKDGFNTFLGKSYRFITFEGLFKTVENMSLRFTRVDKFNDPLDNSPFIVPYDWSDYLVHGLGFIDFMKSHVFSKVFSSTYVCSFCKEYDTYDSYLMWAHYGQSHTQVCFEIDFSLNGYLGGPSDVLYPDDIVKFRDELKTKTQDELGLYIVTTKLKQWKYENEVRLIVDILSPTIDFSKYSSSTDNYFLYVPFDTKNISKVIFGVNSDKFNEVKTIRMFNDKGLQPIFQKMIIDPVTLTMKPIIYNLDR